MKPTTYSDLVTDIHALAEQFRDLPKPVVAMVASDATLRAFIHWARTRHAVTVEKLDRSRPPLDGIPMVVDDQVERGTFNLVDAEFRVRHRYRLVGDRLLELPLEVTE